jgi:hypothetical protein
MPEGHVRFVSNDLVAKFASVTKANLIKIKEEFIDSRLEDESVDPDFWIDGIDLVS